MREKRANLADALTITVYAASQAAVVELRGRSIAMLTQATGHRRHGYRLVWLGGGRARAQDTEGPAAAPVVAYETPRAAVAALHAAVARMGQAPAVFRFAYAGRAALGHCPQLVTRSPGFLEQLVATILGDGAREHRVGAMAPRTARA